YGSALVEFTAERLKIYPNKADPDAKLVTVRTEVKRANGDRVAVNYYLRRTPQGWKAWDVVIDGISYVNSYRTDFGEQIEAQGIDAVIKRLEAGEKPGAVGKQTGDKRGGRPGRPRRAERSSWRRGRMGGWWPGGRWRLGPPGRR